MPTVAAGHPAPQRMTADLLSALKIGWAQPPGVPYLGALGGASTTPSRTFSSWRCSRTRGKRLSARRRYDHHRNLRRRAFLPRQRCAAGHVNISVFSPFRRIHGSQEPGLKYDEFTTMSNIRVNGVSNEFWMARPHRIEVEHGTLIVTFPAEAPLRAKSGCMDFDGDLGTLDTEVSSILVKRKCA